MSNSQTLTSTAQVDPAPNGAPKLNFTSISRIGLFWAAFVLTRPFGAIFGDLLTKTPDKGGLGFGTIGSSAILAVILVGLVIYTSVQDARAKREIAYKRAAI